MNQAPAWTPSCAGWHIQPQSRLPILLGLVLLTWRMVAVNLCFSWSRNRHMASVPVLGQLGVYASIVLLSILSGYETYWNTFCRYVPVTLMALAALKFILAFVAFRICLKKNLLAPSSLAAYLAGWVLLVAALTAPTLILYHDKQWVFPACVGIILLTPLARIGLCPITMEWTRHT